jgi:hypothetical protein
MRQMMLPILTHDKVSIRQRYLRTKEVIGYLLMVINVNKRKGNPFHMNNKDALSVLSALEKLKSETQIHNRYWNKDTAYISKVLKKVIKWKFDMMIY